MAGIPAAIDAALVALGREPGLSAAMRDREKALDRAISEAYARSPADPAEIEQARKILIQCLELAWKGSSKSRDRAEMPQLEQLVRAFEAHRTGAQAPAPAAAPAPAPAAAPRPPAPASWSAAPAPMPSPAPTPMPPPAAMRAPAPLPPPAVRPAIPRTPQPTPPPTARPAIPRSAPPAPKQEIPKPAPPPAKPFATIPRKHRTNEIVASILDTLAGVYTWRQHLLADPVAHWREFQAMDSQLRAAIWSIGWLQDTALEPAKELFATAEDEAGKFAGAMALLYTGRQDTLMPLMAAPPESAPTEGALTALRMGADVSLLEQVESSIATIGPEMRQWLMSTAGDRGRLSADFLLGLVQDLDDRVACRAAEMLAWVGRSQADARIIEGLLRPDDSPDRQSAFLYAAVALGSMTALQQLRRMLDAGANVTVAVVDALAVAGSVADAERLLHLAARDEALAPVAVLAAGHLGYPIAAAGRPTQRLLGGKPWTLAAALARLADPGELARARQWHALEVMVRTGVRPQIVFDATARVHTQDAAVARLRNWFEQRPRVLPEGGWFYGGQPVA